jgi:hypothetical protein
MSPEAKYLDGSGLKPGSFLERNQADPVCRSLAIIQKAVLVFEIATGQLATFMGVVAENSTGGAFFVHPVLFSTGRSNVGLFVLGGTDLKEIFSAYETSDRERVLNVKWGDGVGERSYRQNVVFEEDGSIAGEDVYCPFDCRLEGPNEGLVFSHITRANKLSGSVLKRARESVLQGLLNASGNPKIDFFKL